MTIIDEGFERQTYTNKSVTLLWKEILGRIERLRKENDLVKLFGTYFSGEYMFGLLEPHIMRLIESLPGVETLTNYAFKYGRLQLLEMPLTLNPTGCARSEPKLRTHFRKSNKLTCNTIGSAGAPPTTLASITQRSASTASGSSGMSNYNNGNNNGQSVVYFNDNDTDDSDDGNEDEFAAMSDTALVSSSYTKQFTISKSSQVKKLKVEWKTNVYLAKSRIQVKIVANCCFFVIIF